ncbi:MAG: MTH1187 family thiamine-binding protein [archaeon GB-1845-036]|nr:MTH1187 family thiamine-binding protein [Candidatus Culexmicrobium thermophilum]RLE53972.1 MAG: thiamine-binding protein [Candidatus Verstraetearchaeota archaeon]HDO19959.1 MTH1187 family thiamine-binding protein [Candidatus Bathyarchaeota archaeon]
MIIVEFSVVPIGRGESVSKYVAEAIKILENENIKYEVTPMGTIFETERLSYAFNIIEKAHEAVIRAGAKRVITSIKIDDRRDKERKMEDKVKSVLERLSVEK